MKRICALALLVVSISAKAQLPNIKPGDRCEKLRGTYGKEVSLEGPAHVWKQGALTIQVLVRPGGPCVAGAVNFIVEPGSVFKTRDGILLGKDTMSEAAAKLRGRINDTNYIFIRGEGKAYGQIEVPPSAAYPYKQTYSWQLRQSAAGKLTTTPVRADFTSEIVNFYTVDPPDPQGMQ
jgi:hypothetical protein